MGYRALVARTTVAGRGERWDHAGMLEQFAWVFEVGQSGASIRDAGDEWFFRLSKALDEQASGLRVAGRRHDASTRPFIQ